MEYLSNLILTFILFFTFVSAENDQKAREGRIPKEMDQLSSREAEVTKGCMVNLRMFGPYNKYYCNCRDLQYCDFSNMGKCNPKKCLSGYGGDFCQLMYLHKYIKNEIMNTTETQNVFTNVAKEIKNSLNITFKKNRRIHLLKFSCQSSVSETNITLEIGLTKFYEGKCKNVTKTGDASGKYLLIKTTQNVSFSMLRVFGCSPFWFGQKCDKQCHCANNNTECHKISGNCPMGCESGRSGSDCQRLNYENVALKKPASQSSTYNSSTILVNNACQKQNFSFSADLAVDGNTDQQNERRSCMHTLKESNSYWQVDLGKSYNISWIRIYHRNKNFFRIEKASIYIDNITCATIGSKVVKALIDIQCENILEGRIVKVIKKEKEALNLCEVQVLQCLHGFYGNRCENSCPECKNTSCEQWTGRCQLGCSLGYKFNKTCTACQNGTFGEGCSQTCHCKDNTNCNKKTGSCISSGCEAGYKGSDCQQSCSIDAFGEGCLQTCHCKNNTNCNKKDGNCRNEGCEAGYKGSTCQEYCQYGTFGERCSQTCHCKDNTNCNKKTGSCIPSGCGAAYKGSDCQQRCSIDAFGEGCLQTCHCKNNTNCNKKDGTCGSEGCEAGYKGPTCQESKCNIFIPIITGLLIIAIISVGLIICFIVKRSKRKKKDTSLSMPKVSLQENIEMDSVESLSLFPVTSRYPIPL